MVKGIRNSKDKNEKLKFIQSSLEMFDNTESQRLKDASIFAVAEIRDIDAFKMIITRNDIDKELKVYTIDFNYLLLDELLSKDTLTSQEIDFVVECMEIHPITDAKVKIVKFRDGSNDKETINKLNKVIANIDAYGANAVIKY